MTADLQLFDPLDEATAAALRESIRRFGVIVPVVRDQHGRILDGHHRSRIAAELGVDCDEIIVKVADEAEAREYARTLNADRRHLTPDQRRPVVTALRSEGHSIRAIAGATGVDPRTVQRDLAGVAGATPPARVIGADGKSYPGRVVRETPPPVVVADYIDQMPPAEQKWERDFRRVGRWGRALNQAVEALQAVPPGDFVPDLGPDDREMTEIRIGLIEDWIRWTRDALTKGAPIRLVKGAR